jgi:uncharacterized protein
MHLPLILTLLAIAAAPVFGGLGRRVPRLEAVGQGFTLVAVAGLVLLQVVPFGVAHAGWPALVALVAGLFFGQSVHRFPEVEGAARWLASVALLVHGLLDGAALAFEDAEAGGDVVAWAVVAHSLPVGVATWRLGLSLGGARAAFALLALSAAATACGYSASGAVLDGSSSWVLAMVQCAVAGTLLHVLAHFAGGEQAPQRSGMGAILGVGVLAAVGAEHPISQLSEGELSATATVFSLAPLAVVAMLSGALAAGPLGRILSRLRPGAGLRPGALSGVALAASLIGVLPVAVVAVVHLAAEVLTREHVGVLAPEAQAERGWRGAFAEFGAAAPWVVVGVVLAEPMLTLPHGGPGAAQAWLLASVAVAVPAGLRWAGAAPLLAVLVHKGLPLGAAVGALVVGEGVSAGLAARVWREGRRAAAAAVVARWAAAGLAAGALVLTLLPPSAPPLHTWSELPLPTQLGAVAVLSVGAAILVLKRGPLGFLSPLRAVD